MKDAGKEAEKPFLEETMKPETVGAMMELLAQVDKTGDAVKDMLAAATRFAESINNDDICVEKLEAKNATPS